MSSSAGTGLVIEDEQTRRRFVCDAGGREACITFEAGDVVSGLDMAARLHPDLVVLDLGLPDCSGMEFIRQLRIWSTVPILILSARAGETDKVAALDAGADDYLTKPFGIAELLARSRALLRRNLRETASPVRCFGDVEIDLARRVVTRSGRSLRLTPLEYRLLATLVANDGKVLTHKQLLRDVWGPGYAEQVHYLKVYVGRLRQKIETDPARPCYLLTETGVGYRFKSN